MERAFDIARRVIVFTLGIVIIVDALVSKGSPVSELVIGLIMVGILPLDELVKITSRRSNGDK